MRFEKRIQLKDGRSCILRNARMEDAAALLEYLKVTPKETPFLMREPEEIQLTLEQEESFIQRQMESERDIMLIAELDGKHVGNASVTAMGNFLRYQHRCSVAIALYQKYCGLGIGKQMLETVLEVAREIGYEQAELEVVTTNDRAIRLYERLGFETYGRQMHSMKYKDGSYADELLMMKRL